MTSSHELVTPRAQRPRRRRAMAVLAGGATLAATVAIQLAAPAPASAAGVIHITEWMYSGPGGEFAELTNTGDEPIDFSGWSLDDANATQGTFDLSGLGEVAAGESVVVTQSDPAAFRTEWNLCESAKVLNLGDNPLGPNDQINIYDAADALADQLTYGHTDFPGSIRTQEVSGWVSAAGLGANDITEWTLSAVDDTESSWTSAGGAIGSPGASTHGGFDPCDDGGAAPLDPATIATGDRWACGLDTEGLPYCWGEDAAGQLGNGSDVADDMTSPYPVDISGLPDGTVFESLTTGTDHVCGLTTDGVGYCWGEGLRGRLGTGHATEQDQHSPVAIDISGMPDGTTWRALSAGGVHSCGITAEGVGYCWGNNGNGHLLGASADVTGNQHSPVPLDAARFPAGTQLASISAGGTHSCAVASDGVGYCWGSNSNGELGIDQDTSFHEQEITAVATTGLPDGTSWRQLSAGSSGHTCGTTTDGVGYCWGTYFNGRLGVGPDFGDRYAPAPVVTTELPDGAQWATIEAGSTYSCGLTTDGDAYCWGFGGWGVLGTGNDDSQDIPTAVDTSVLPAGTVFDEISVAPDNLACAATAVDTVWCWGVDANGQLGNGPALTDVQYSPTLVEPMESNEGLPPSIGVDPATLAGAVGDPTNAPATLRLSDPDTPVEDLDVTVSVADESVLAPADVTVTGDGAERDVAFEPIGRGITTVTFVVTDPDGNGQSATMDYGASTGMLDTETGRYHHHLSDLSSAIDLGDGLMLSVDDEANDFYVHQQVQSGPPIAQIRVPSQDLGTSDEIDFESMARIDDTLVVFGSHGNSRNGPSRPDRRVAVALQMTGSGADLELSATGRYEGLWNDLRSWDQSDGHGLGADALGFVAGTQSGVLPNAPDGFNIEGVEIAPDGTTGYLGFRAPTVEIDGTYHAVIVPVDNLLDLFDGMPASGPANFADPILMDLDGRSIRDLRRNDQGDYLISAGPSPQNESWALYTWNGDGDTSPQFSIELPNNEGGWTGTWETIVAVPEPFEEGSVVRLVADDGRGSLYGTGDNKDLSEWLRKSYSQELELGPVDGSDPDEGDVSIEVVVPEVVEPGEFVWSIDGDPNVAMSEAANMGSYLHSTGELTPIVVTDTREGGPEWSLSGQVSDFTDGLPGSYLGWIPDVLTPGAGATAGDPVASGFESGNGLADPATLASADAGHDAGSGTVGADLDLRLPVDTPAGTYTATLTITALS